MAKHPEYGESVFTCACGNVIKTRSTRLGNISIEICSKCHPFYTGAQQKIKAGSRVDRFNQRLAASKK